MPLLQMILVAVIQGITEFLPVSSSGHLILLPSLTGMEDQGQAIDVAVHIGTLAAVILYFWRDVKVGFAGLPRALTGRMDTDGSHLAMMLIVATIPVVIAGLILHVTGVDQLLRSTAVIGWAMLIFGIVLYWMDQKGDQYKTANDWSIADALRMGLWQAVALIPGTSRSGITITGARAMNYARRDAAKLSMLMSIPAIMASGVLLGADVIRAGEVALLKEMGIMAAMAFVAALLSLSLMMKLLNSVSFTPYVIYRIILGVVLLFIAYS